MTVCCEYTDQINEFILRWLGLVCVSLGIILIFVDGSGFGYVASKDVGNWWFVIFIVIAGVLGVFSHLRRIAFFALIFSILGIGSAMYGLVIYFHEYLHEFKNMEACYSPEFRRTYGAEEYQDRARECFLSSLTDAFTGTFTDTLNATATESQVGLQHAVSAALRTTISALSGDTVHHEVNGDDDLFDCYCVARHNTQCFTYDVVRHNTCYDILTKQKQTLIVSIVFAGFCISVLIVFAVIACLTTFFEFEITKCCNRPIYHNVRNEYRDIDEMSNFQQPSGEKWKTNNTRSTEKSQLAAMEALSRDDKKVLATERAREKEEMQSEMEHEGMDLYLVAEQKL